jgi:UrcA family protein
MNTSTVTRSWKYAVIAGVGAIVGTTAFFSPAAVAEQTADQPEAMEGITIVAPYVVHRKVVGRSTIGAPVEVLSLSRSVSYSDLDLTKAADAAELKKRISDTAKDACDYLFSRNRGITLPPVTTSRACAKTAAAEAMMVANDVIAASNS